MKMPAMKLRAWEFGGDELMNAGIVIFDEQATFTTDPCTELSADEQFLYDSQV